MARGFSAPARFFSVSRPAIYRSAPRTFSAPRFGFSPLRSVMGLTGAMGLNRFNMSGPAIRGPIVSRSNPVANRFYNAVNQQSNLRSITKGPFVPSFGGFGIGAGRMAQARGERMSVEAFQRNAMQNANKSSTPVVKYRDPKTGQVSDRPFNQMGLNRFGNNQSWRFQQNNTRQGGNNRYSGGMSQFSINAPSGVGLNRMR